MNEKKISKYLKEICNNYNDDFRFNELPNIIKTNKEISINEKDKELAKHYWCLQKILKSQNKYIDAFINMKKEEFYKGWCELEESQISIHFLSNHLIINNDYHLEFIDVQIEKFQKIFPYKIFFSTEFLEKEIRCSICDKVITPRNKCEHKVGEIYNGEMCSRKITDFEALGIAIVKNPTHKYSVVFAQSDDKTTLDNYNYAMIKYLIERLISPFDNWNYEFTKKRHPHTRYKHIGRNDKCPCESGKKYKKCCLLEEGVLRPHVDFIFNNPPPNEMLKMEYV
ncbi:MAG: SEC-C domain-containing protein [Ignavibacteria bacterium]|nr:SEC-C domain-containing protein [Ignavibacteria bacterium]